MCSVPAKQAGIFCYGDKENGHRACTNEHLTTANQSEIRKAHLVSGVLRYKNLTFGVEIFGMMKAPLP